MFKFSTALFRTANAAADPDARAAVKAHYEAKSALHDAASNGDIPSARP